MAKKPVGSFYVQLGLNTKEFSKNIRTANRDLKKAFGPAAIKASKGLALAVTGVAVAMAGVAAKSVKMYAELERQRVALTRIMGSAEGAKKRLEELQAFAAVTPYTFTELIEWEKRLRALGFAAEDVDPTLRTLGDAAAGLGMRADGMERLIKAMGDIRAKGVLQATEIRQFAENGIPILEMLSEKLNVTTNEVFKLTEQRLLDAETVLSAVTEGINKRFGGMMALQAETMIGMWSTVRDEAEGTMRVFGRMITESAGLQRVMRRLRDAAKSFRRTLEDKGFAEAFSNLFGEHAHYAVKTLAGAVTGMLVPAFYALGIAVNASMLPLLKLAAVYAAVGAGVFLIVDKLEAALTKKDPLEGKTVDELEDIYEERYKRRNKAMADYSQLTSPAVSHKRASGDISDTEVMLASVQYKGAQAELDKVKEALTAAKDRQRKDFEEIKKAFSDFSKSETVKPFTSFFKNLLPKKDAKVGLTATATVDTDSLIKEAESTSRSIKDAWVRQTQDRLTQINYQYQKEKETLDKSKAYNKNYRRDLSLLDETYYHKRAKLEEEANIKEAEAIIELTKQRARDIEEQIHMEQKLAEAKFERIQADLDGSATEAQLREYNRQADLEGYIEYLDEEKAAYRAHLEGKRNLMETYNQFQRDAHRTNADYAAEGYRTVYTGLTDVLTQVITNTKSAGEAFKQLGMQIIQMFVKWQVQKKLSHIMAESMKATSTATSMAQAAAIAAAWAPAAMFVNMATFGGSAGAAKSMMSLAQGMSPIPFMADGGIVTKPTLAMIGEGGESEAVIPLSKLKNIGGSGDLTVNVNNNSGVPMQAKASQRMDGGRTVIDLFLDGYERNVSGIQDIIGARS